MSEVTAVGDLTGDGHPDLLAVQTSTGRLYLYPSRGTSLGAGRLLGPGWAGMSELTPVGDFNRDGHVDLAVRANATGALWLYPGKGTGLGARRLIGLRAWNGMRDLVGVGDFDRDGFNDLLAIQGATKMLLLYRGRGTSLQPALRVRSNWTTDFEPLM